MRRALEIQSKVRTLWPILGLLLVSACGGISLGGRPGATCLPNTAQIEIYDNGMRRGCGCVEPIQFFPSPNQLNPMICTVNINTTVLFTYVGITTDHQISVQGSVGFQTRGPSDTSEVDRVTMVQTGSFSVVDIPFQFFAQIMVL